ncbi:hypothetical protein AB0M50_36335 [Nonomuraea fuscirosea]|uniref:hypothetical protein n=1 Tax=Nonomuraea fuscirosea TaxID=1291556 RepID=UPI002DDBB3A8|nr:hypothetical protein [Nonomuraea fuscirosea]WSA53715.1 hypothetical protein OIE67_03495 [Nonomuraea fuscirosea]
MKACVALVATVSALVTGSAVSDDKRPNAAPLAWHSGWFVKTMCYKDARKFSQEALTYHGYRTAYTPPNAVLGSNGTTMVEVSYAPAQTSYNPAQFAKIHFTVTGISNSSSSAETARNRVRERIVKKSYYDTC